MTTHRDEVGSYLPLQVFVSTCAIRILYSVIHTPSSLIDLMEEVQTYRVEVPRRVARNFDVSEPVR